jgi:hypothetical protein
MSKPKMVLGLLGAFVLGCAATQIAPLVVPPARAGTSPQKWEYYCMAAEGGDLAGKLAGTFNPVGAQGWELVTTASSDRVASTCFKRPL